MFRFGFAESRAYLRVCQDEMRLLEDSCTASEAAMSAMLDGGFSGDSATAAETEFLVWYAEAHRDLTLLTLMHEVGSSIHADAQVIKYKAESVPASIGAAAQTSMLWESSGIAVDAHAYAAETSAQSICDVDITGMEGTISSMRDLLTSVSQAGGIPGAISSLEGLLLEQRRQLDALREAVSSLLSGVSDFEGKYSSFSADLSGALDAAAAGGGMSGFIEDVIGIAGSLSNSALGRFSDHMSTTAQKCLEEVGIERMGRYRFEKGKVIFSGFKMAEGARKMTTICNVLNIGKLSRPSAVFKSEGMKGAGKGAGGLGKGLGVAGGVWGVGSAYNDEYEAGEGLDEGRRRSNATVEAGVEFAGVLSSAGAGAAAGAAFGSLCPGAGTVAGAVIGFAAGLIGEGLFELAENHFFRQEGDDGRSMIDNTKDWIYENIWPKP